MKTAINYKITIANGKAMGEEFQKLGYDRMSFAKDVRKYKDMSGISVVSTEDKPWHHLVLKYGQEDCFAWVDQLI